MKGDRTMPGWASWPGNSIPKKGFGFRAPRRMRPIYTPLI